MSLRTLLRRNNGSVESIFNIVFKKKLVNLLSIMLYENLKLHIRTRINTAGFYFVSFKKNNETELKINKK